jgi:GT2 family glycosyltransferase
MAGTTRFSTKLRALLRHPLKADKRRKYRLTELGRGRSTDDIQDYADWVRLYDTISSGDRRAMSASLIGLKHRPLISIVMPVYSPDDDDLREAIESVRNQTYPNWELCAVDDASPTDGPVRTLDEYAASDNRIKWVRRYENGHISAASNTALGIAGGEFVALLDQDDLLAPHALYEVVAELNKFPDADIIYSDEDKIDEYGNRSEPYFKTDWNPELFLCHNMISHLGVYRRTLIDAVGGFRVGFEGSQDYDLALRCVAATQSEKIRHIPAILYHWRRSSEGSEFSKLSLDRCIASARKAKSEYLASVGDPGEVIGHPKIEHWDRVVRQVPSPPPLVSLIVPTRNRADLLGPCLDGLMYRTSYEPIEIIVIDHQSDDPETLMLLERAEKDSRVRIMRYEGEFNYSAMNNRAVEIAQGEIIGFINNDTDVVTPEWLTEMVALAMRPRAGAIGAKLLYPHGPVQHAGVGIGIGGIAGHLFHNAGPEENGYFGRLQLVSNISAVTGACLVIKKRIFQDVGGFNETDLRVAFNDIDLCLKIRKKGLLNAWTPFAVLIHHESPSRGHDTEPENQARFRREADWMEQTWGSFLKDDPFLNPNLSLDGGCFSLAFPPRRKKPWQDFLNTETATGPFAPVAEPVIRQNRGRATTTGSLGASPLDAYVNLPPGDDLAFDIFEGQWSSRIPGYGGGGADLFNDARMNWFASQCGGFRDKKILELGPLEGGHTFMMATAGCSSVTAIESNVRAFLKCLIVKNAFKFEADFKLGNFVPYLRTCSDRYDVLIASGVLYHMTEPTDLLRGMARVCDSLCIWTHYYDEAIISANETLRPKFDATPRVETFDGRKVDCHRQRYLDALDWPGFCGGATPFSYWLTKRSLFDVIESLGFSITVGQDTPLHPNGPAITLFARRVVPDREAPVAP